MEEAWDETMGILLRLCWWLKGMGALVLEWGSDRRELRRAYDDFLLSPSDKLGVVVGTSRWTPGDLLPPSAPIAAIVLCLGELAAEEVAVGDGTMLTPMWCWCWWLYGVGVALDDVRSIPAD